ncbi:hypothetical protein GE09DRAFT_1139826 [Coniochaeta sp. 2T2.1]|nr:hypothetical protein GE09DRAFT_1139826 [Coniochaeta sp. 2T2.1]
MFKRTPRSKSSWTPGGGPSTPSSSRRETTDGLFERGQWFCDCEPREPAIHLQVKKANKNRGRWFYKCQKDRKEQCSFWMWEDVAQKKEKEYLFGGGRERDEGMIVTHIGSSEPPLPEHLGGGYASQSQSQRHSNRISDDDGRGYSLPTVSTGDELDFMSWADQESQNRGSEMPVVKEEEEDERRPAVAPAAGKRKRGPFVDDSEDDDLFGDTDIGSDAEREMLRLAESAKTQSQSQSQQRRESQSQQSGQFTTPSAQRTHDVFHGMPTPNTRSIVPRNSLVIAREEREAKRQRMDPSATPSSAMEAGTGSSSSTARQRSEARSSGVCGEDYPITEEVMALLGGEPMLDDDVANSVRRKLNEYALRMKGVESGRDMVRSIVKTKEARIAELQGRVAQLEKDRIADRERIKKLASMVSELSS